jgi:hypothetical protein
MDSMDLKTEKFTFDTVVKRFEAEKAALYRPDGAPKYGDKEHSEKVAALLEPVIRWHDKVIEKCAAAETEAKAAKALEHTDNFTSLSDSELSRAYHLRPFVQDAVNNMTLAELAGRLSAIVSTGDKAAVATYYQAAAQRRQSLSDASRSGAQVDLLGIGAVSEHLDALAGKLADPKHAQALANAIELRKAAAEIGHETNQRLRELNGEHEAAIARQTAEYRAFF